MSKTVTEFVPPSSPTDIKKISDAIQEMDNCLTRIDAEKDQYKAIQDRLKDEFEMPGDLSSRLAKTLHKRDFDVQEGKFEEFQTTFQKFFPSV